MVRYPEKKSSDWWANSGVRPFRPGQTWGTGCQVPPPDAGTRVNTVSDGGDALEDKIVDGFHGAPVGEKMALLDRAVPRRRLAFGLRTDTDAMSNGMLLLPIKLVPGYIPYSNGAKERRPNNLAGHRSARSPERSVNRAVCPKK